MSRFTRALLVPGMSAAAAVALMHPAFAQEQTLKMANWVPPVHHMSNTLNAWVKTIEQASGGKLTVAVDKSPLASPPGQYDLAKNGIRDLVWGVAGYTAGRMPLLRGVEIPFASPSAELGSVVLQKWYTKHGFEKKEFPDTKLILTFVHGPGILHSKQKITTLEEIKNVKIRVGGGGVPIAQNLGAVPVAIPATSAHESLQRGTTDAAFFPWESIKGFRLAELVKFHLEIPGGLYTTAFYITASPKAWDKLSSANKEALMKAGGIDGARFVGKHWDAADQVGRDEAKKAGNTITTISDSEQERWRKAVQPVYDDWIKQADAKGLDGKALLDELVTMMREAK